MACSWRACYEGGCEMVRRWYGDGLVSAIVYLCFSAIYALSACAVFLAFLTWDVKGFGMMLFFELGLKIGNFWGIWKGLGGFFCFGELSLRCGVHLGLDVGWGFGGGFEPSFCGGVKGNFSFRDLVGRVWGRCGGITLAWRV
jgi:hypothetical protein